MRLYYLTKGKFKIEIMNDFSGLATIVKQPSTKQLIKIGLTLIEAEKILYFYPVGKKIAFIRKDKFNPLTWYKNDVYANVLNIEQRLDMEDPEWE